MKNKNNPTSCRVIETLENGEFRVVPLDDPAFIEFTNKRNGKMSTVKIAINRCFGGFGLSNKAFELLLSKKGVEFEKKPSKKSFGGGVDYYTKGHVDEYDHYLSEHSFCEDRSDADLIAVIEELGKDSWGWASDLAIVEIPDDVKWHIHEYDGMEHVAEDHRTWYGD